MSGCHPYVSEIIKPSMRNSPGLLELNVDLYPAVRVRLSLIV